MNNLNNVYLEGQIPPDLHHTTKSLGWTAPTVSLIGLADLIAALEPQLAMLPVPTQLFAVELEKLLVEASESSR